MRLGFIAVLILIVEKRNKRSLLRLFGRAQWVFDKLETCAETQMVCGDAGQLHLSSAALKLSSSRCLSACWPVKATAAVLLGTRRYLVVIDYN